MKETSTACFEGVREWKDTFLALFPHRFDYIWAEHPSPGAAVEWKTESRHPLNDRLVRQAAYLYGVRFGAETNYCLLDIDIGSPYHPRQDPLAISRITAALEPLGLVSYIACTSSYSSGLHLYFPFQHPQSSWQLAIALACLLENAGFTLKPGHLETFPNPKPFATDGNLSLFNAHRLPLQIGSYLLNETWQPIWSTSETFVKQWQFCQQRNDINSKSLKQILKQAKRRHFGISGKAEKFINDLNAEIELGWTGYGQTNRLLGRITMRAYIFHHILSGGEPLQGNALVNEIVEVAQALPGYQDWCRHQHEIEHRATEWARCIENSHYFHFGTQSKAPKPAEDPELTAAINQSPSWNQRQFAATRDRIRRAIADLLEKNSLPAKPTARFHTLLKYGIGGASLYRHRDLWHPNYFEVDEAVNDNDTESSTEVVNPASDYGKAKTNCHTPPSLFPINGGDNLSCNASSTPTSSTLPSDVGNFSVHCSSSQQSEGVSFVHQTLFNIKATQDAVREASRIVQPPQLELEAAIRQQIVRMQQFLDSGDPILMAEALAWAQVHPGVLNLNRLQLALLTDAQRQQLDFLYMTAEEHSQFGQEDGNDYLE